MLLKINQLSSSTCGGGIDCFVNTETFELIYIGIDDLWNGVDSHEPLTPAAAELIASGTYTEEMLVDKILDLE